jgi:hypothetical protein
MASKEDLLIEASRESKQTAYMATVPASKKLIVKKAFQGALSPRKAIKAKCYDCTNFQIEEIRECRSFICALWKYRPYQKK